MIKIAYVGRSFFDYRVPVFAALDKLSGGGLHLFFSKEVTPPRVCQKIKNILGDRSLGFCGELCLGPKVISDFANTKIRFVYQPGLLRAISQFSPSVIITDGFFQWAGMALLYRFIHGTPLVVCYERTFHTERNAQWYRTLYRKAVLPLVDAMAVNGRLCAEYVQWLGMPIERLTLGHMVADTAGLQQAAAAVTEEERQSLRSRWGEPEVVFLVVAKLIRRKGISQLLTAWSLGEPAWRRKAALVVVGDGPEKSNLLAQTRAAGLRSVYFEGAVDYDRIASYYAAADAFIIPTLEDNWSLVVPEAMACGLPILCSKYNGCWPELVQEKNGWVFDPLDPNDTLQVLKESIAQGPRLPLMGQESQRIIAGHTPRHAAESIFQACQIALRRHSIRKSFLR